MTENTLYYKIIALREAGYTWWQCDQQCFPGLVTKDESNNGKSPSWKFAKKFKAAAFTKATRHPRMQNPVKY